MNLQIEKRLRELKAEFEAGQKMMVDLESKQANLRNTLLQISGAIQVLEELIAAESDIGEVQGQAGRKTEIEIKALE